jgi:hypothetical protein
MSSNNLIIPDKDQLNIDLINEAFCTYLTERRYDDLLNILKLEDPSLHYSLPISYASFFGFFQISLVKNAKLVFLLFSLESQASPISTSICNISSLLTPQTCYLFSANRSSKYRTLSFNENQEKPKRSLRKTLPPNCFPSPMSYLQD